MRSHLLKEEEEGWLFSTADGEYDDDSCMHCINFRTIHQIKMMVNLFGVCPRCLQRIYSSCSRLFCLGFLQEFNPPKSKLNNIFCNFNNLLELNKLTD